MKNNARNCSILIPTFNGRDILAECLPSVISEVDARGGVDEIILLDNASSDGTDVFIESNFPSVRYVRINENKAIFAINDGAEIASNELLFFLNNDIILKPGCLDALLDAFAADDIFAVTGKIYQWDRETIQAARRRPAFSRGAFYYLPAGDDAGLTLHALGGQSVFRRETFLALGGLDPLFSPFYHEDLDISWRALRSGHRILYEPGAEMIHRGAATAGRIYSKNEIRAIMQKNLFLFIWKNIHDPSLFRAHLYWLLPRALRALISGDFVYLRGLAGALKQLGEALKARKSVSESELSDEDVTRLFDREVSQ